MARAKNVAIYLVAAFLLYIIVTAPDRAADLVQIGFEGISSAAKSVGDFLSELLE
ncbi:hypothetical protein [Streptomyces clavuligerus]|nr:hypothetical protein [Streptomyces clavuligerus]MBY6303705.1 hypothetical protein [Streptomyces clavuligerus]QPL63786.1 hypothetical protein I3J04_13555 [Streptomyces clavuligerus]QPL69814.1 hypothetical protein I3J05_13565 [Streptomyces clavuligerus]QPL75896.1 hypothetical protein I3J06_13570 [Streptomyces clavuligerus]QPL81922.1 hypothetical protein I3J07_13610 [Streptomyces clavuligerus]